MKYLCLVYSEPNEFGPQSENEENELVNEHLDYDEQLRQSGHFVIAEALQPIESATTVRVRGAKVSISDGPFAETKELLGGFFLINARDINQAIEIASKIPSARMGCIEIRPVLEFK